VADQVRKKDFKEYEMDKEHLRREKLKSMDERTRVEEETKFKEQQKQHKEHPVLHHPVRITVLLWCEIGGKRLFQCFAP